MSGPARAAVSAREHAEYACLPRGQAQDVRWHHRRDATVGAMRPPTRGTRTTTARGTSAASVPQADRRPLVPRL